MGFSSNRSTSPCYQLTVLHMHAIYTHTQYIYKMNLSTVTWAQWDKTQLFGLFICVCIALCTIIAHNTAQNRPDNFLSYSQDNHHSSDDVYLREGGLNKQGQQGSNQHLQLPVQSWHSLASKVANCQLSYLHLTYPTCIWRLHQGDPIWICREIFGIRKLRLSGLSCDVVCVILRLAVSVGHQLVTDGQTDTRRAGKKSSSMDYALRSLVFQLHRFWEMFAQVYSPLTDICHVITRPII